jgi:hypothetical protein
LVEPLTTALFGVTDELAKAVLVVLLNKPDVSFCNCRSVLSCEGMVVPDCAIVIVALNFQVRKLALVSDVTAADRSSAALGCTIVNGPNSNPSDIRSSGWSN